MATSSSDVKLPSPLSSCKATSKPKGRKRYGDEYESSISSTSSSREWQPSEHTQGQHYKKARSFYHKTESKKVKRFESTDILCLYPKDSYFGTYPTYIRYIKQHPSPVDTIVETLTYNLEKLFENTELDFKAFGVPTLDEEQKQLEDFVFTCVDNFFGGLESDKANNWIDSNNLGIVERRERCEAIAKNYGIYNKDFTEVVVSQLILLHEGFINGFSNGFGRSAIESLFRICLLILRLSGKHVVMNLGGSSTRFPGNSTTLQVYSTSSGEPTREEAEKELSAETAEVKVWVPDSLMFTYKKFPHERREYYFFGECKSGHASKKTLYYQLWHESLRGLIDADVVYSCGMCSSFMTLCKSFVEDGILETHVISMFFEIAETSWKNKSFDITKFKKFIQYMTKTIQDKET